MWIVRLALRRPYTFVVAAMLVAILGLLADREDVDRHLPNIDIPVISICFNYAGMSPDDVESGSSRPTSASGHDGPTTSSTSRVNRSTAWA